jgi:hypothetical protein
MSVMAVVIIGQVPAQLVKMKSAIQTLPRKSCKLNAWPLRSVRENSGTALRMGSGSSFFEQLTIKKVAARRNLTSGKIFMRALF